MIPDCQRRLQQAHAELTALLVRYAVLYDYGESHSILAMICLPLVLQTTHHVSSWHHLVPVSGTEWVRLVFRPASWTESWNGSSKAAFVATSKIWYQSPANIAQWWLSLNLHEPVFRFECNIVDQWSSIQQEIHCCNTVDYFTHGY